MKFFSGVRLLISALILAGLGFGLQGCGGGGGGTSNPADANPTGYYDITGTVNIDDDGAGGGSTAITDLEGMINGTRFMMISDVHGLMYDGTITSISANDFAANVSIFKHGQPIANPSASISGTITEKSKVEGTITGTGAGNSSGMFTLQYATNNNKAANVSRIERTGGNVWGSKLSTGSSYSDFNIDSAGNLVSSGGTASNGFFVGCDLGNGSFTPITGTSLYNVTMNVTGCTDTTIHLTYVGLAASLDRFGVDGALVIGVTDSKKTYSINGDFILQ